MTVTFQSVRFGAVEIPASDVIDFPLGLIGLGGSRYALLDRNPGTGFYWLHSVDDAALGLPVVHPEIFFADFALEIAPEDREQTGIEDLGAASVYVTVRASSDPLQTTANLRAPIVVAGGRGYQVINMHENAPLRAPLFVLEQSAQPDHAGSPGAA
jgi:flagellar assembly factor FliW